MLSSFFKMSFRLLEMLQTKIQKSNVFMKLIVSPNLASLCIRVFGIGVSIPNSPNNNSIISSTGLEVLDAAINVMKMKSLECINLVLKA